MDGLRALELGTPGDLRAELNGLVLDGSKRATAGLLSEYAEEQEELEHVGERLALLDDAGARVATLEVTSVEHRRFADVPWDVIVILVGLGLVSELFATTRVFSIVALQVTRRSAGNPSAIAALFAIAMYLVSGLVNNLTALLLVLPVLLVLLRLLGVGQRHATWTLGVLLVACNLGGAATPIGAVWYDAGNQKKSGNNPAFNTSPVSIRYADVVSATEGARPASVAERWARSSVPVSP